MPESGDDLPLTVRLALLEARMRLVVLALKGDRRRAPPALIAYFFGNHDMRRILAATLALSLVGCQTTSYEQYAAAMVRVAEANASVAREQAAAMIALARDGGDQTARTVAILMLAMGAQGKTNGAQLQPPPNEALQWASILLPTVSTLALGWWGWKTNTAAINANSANTIASYEAIIRASASRSTSRRSPTCDRT